MAFADNLKERDSGDALLHTFTCFCISGTWGSCIKKMVEVETLLAGSGGVIENKDILIKSVWLVHSCLLRE